MVNSGYALETQQTGNFPSSPPSTDPTPETLAPQDILTLAKQANPKVIAALMNHTTKSHGILTQVARRDDCLHVLLEGDSVPNQAMLVNFVQDGIRRLEVEAIATIKVYGRKKGEHSVAWNHEIQLQPKSVPEVSAITPVIQDPLPPDYQAPTVAAEPLVIDPPPADTPLELAESDVPVDFAESIEPSWLDKPEAVVLIIFVSMLMLWQMYLELLDEVDNEEILSSKRLAERLGVSYSTISRRRLREDFTSWSQSLDPEGIAWIYNKGRFIPQT